MYNSKFALEPQAIYQLAVDRIDGNHVWILICCKLMMRFLYSDCIPVALDMIVKRVPLRERSLCISLLQVGQNLITITTFVTPEIIYEAMGWSALYYLPETFLL